MKVSSSAALGTLTVATPELNTDVTLQLIIAVASKLQLTVVQQPKKAALSLALPSGKSLKQRNAILRCLAGMGLHNALDNHDMWLLGGHSGPATASAQHAMALASLSSWMSVADHYRSNPAQLAELWSQVESHLETRAFLIPSAVPTLADVDVASVLLLGKATPDVQAFPNISRWYGAVRAFLESHGVTMALGPFAPVKASTPPMFFFGDEENVELPQRQKVVKKAEAKPDQSKKGGKGQAQAEKGKGKKEQQPAKKGNTPPATDSYDISAMDIRVGKIVKAWNHPEAEKLYCEEIDVGEEQPRQIASGLRPFYASPDDLTGQTVMVLCNLKKRNLVGFPSHGMVLCASNEDHTKVELMTPPKDTPPGERVMFEGIEMKDPEPENKVAKKKVWEAVGPALKTNADGVCMWKDAVSKTTNGPVKAINGMSNAHVA
eukprot:Nitzschia sp. Nitz4//scaffold60_size111251//94161//95462//NITZ4_004161-RA/size111251-processed-gene-0.17-mRNA-1//1//CDS//3329555606//922//frame0